MKMKLLCLVFLLSTAAQAAPIVPELKPLPQQAEAAHLSAEVLTRYHYKTLPLDDAMSEKIFDQYLKSLDPEKLFFDQADIDRLADLRDSLDDAILKEDLSAPFAIFNLYSQRVIDRFSYARTLLKQTKGFDFQQKENYQYGREKEPWMSSEADIRDVWRKRVKNDWLRLKLAGKSDKSIVETLDKRYDNAQKRVNQITSEDAFQTFMNAYTMAIEPHTNYMGQRAAAEFDISMKLSLVGIGAVLAEKDDYTTIREVVAGGPAALSGKLKSGDRILGVAQGEKGVMTDVQGWRLDDTVALIRGAADSTVVLDVLPADAGTDGKHLRISLIRKKIALEEQSAKKTIISVANEKPGRPARRIGVITLPGFYEDVSARQDGDKNFKSATRDVERLLGELKKEKVDGVLMDLRNNGGGSLSEAIGLTGLFIDKGPVLQTRDARGKVTVDANTHVDLAWDGPFGVLINRGSASASEIFAAAIQDYGRGLVIGEPSFGKGTVQTMIDLDEIAKNEKPAFGELKLTIAQFFRVNGGTTQLHGVTPDITFPSATNTEDFGESSFDNALPWTQVKAAQYSANSNLMSLTPTLITRHESRVKSDKSFMCLQDNVADFNLQNKTKLISLNEAERLKERESRETRQASCDLANNVAKDSKTGITRKGVPADKNALRDDGLQPDERKLAIDLAAERSRKNAKDPVLDEAAHIIGDEAELLKPGADLANNAKLGSI